MAKTIGIDLGTTNSCMAVMEAGAATVLKNAEGDKTTPSCVALTKDGALLIGQAAKRQAVTNPASTLTSIKRLMGRKAAEVGTEEQIAPYALVEGANGDASVLVNGRPNSPPEISAMILQKLKRDAEGILGETVGDRPRRTPATSPAWT